MAESNIQPLCDEKLTGELQSVLRQIDAMRHPEKVDVKYLTQAYPSHQAQASLWRAFRHWGKGTLSDAEFHHVRARCEEALATPPEAG
jgi:hypothetical protein